MSATEAHIRYSEIFYSLQGEGRFVGVPSVFLRTFGCNFHCHGFSQPRSRSEWLPVEDMPYMRQDLRNITSLAQLPVPEIGCDSSASWSARYRHLAPFEDISTIADRLIAQVPGTSTWRTPSGQDVHLIITGGEPLLGWQRAIGPLLALRAMQPMRHLTFETNGTQPLKPVLRDILNERARRLDEGNGAAPLQVTFSISPKLSISGELWAHAIRPDAVRTYDEIPGRYLYLKFVAETEDDFAELARAVQAYRDAGVSIDAVYVMPVGATDEVYQRNRREVADLCLKYGYRFSPRMHVDIFGNRFGT